jgi:hypothetical protein
VQKKVIKNDISKDRIEKNLEAIESYLCIALSPTNISLCPLRMAEGFVT